MQIVKYGPNKRDLKVWHWDNVTKNLKFKMCVKSYAYRYM